MGAHVGVLTSAEKANAFAVGILIGALRPAHNLVKRCRASSDAAPDLAPAACRLRRARACGVRRPGRFRRQAPCLTRAVRIVLRNAEPIVMFRYLLAFLAISSTAGFTAVPASRVVMSRIASTQAEPVVVPRVNVAAQMSAVTERDADGNPVVHYEMYVLPPRTSAHRRCVPAPSSAKAGRLRRVLPRFGTPTRRRRGAPL